MNKAKCMDRHKDSYSFWNKIINKKVSEDAGKSYHNRKLPNIFKCDHKKIAEIHEILDHFGADLDFTKKMLLRLMLVNRHVYIT
jgi:hypothetical protein